MRYALWAVALAGCCVAGVGYLIGLIGEHALVAPMAAEAADAPAAKPKGPPPLKVDRSAPLLLLDSPPEKKTLDEGMGPKADNSACYVCHANYEEEELVHQHAIADVGCVKCHGESIPHRNDENNITPPDVMYPADAIDTACVKCHETHDAPARKVLARFTERCPGKKSIDAVICTDCHGDHRSKLRTVRWDKKTGKLISASGPKPQAATEQKKELIRPSL